MTEPVYYNEIDKDVAKWLRELIEAGHIAHGVVDERSIEDVRPRDLRGFKQCHFFAGIGVWSYALRRAGWPDDRPAWTGSCPCQPFSAAGKGNGFADERHLWPAWYDLIGQCEPDTVLGEQVASQDGLAWLDLVQSDMEAENYAFAPVDLCAAGVGAPHIRQRLFFVADSRRAHGQRWAGSKGPVAEDATWRIESSSQSQSRSGLGSNLGSLDNTDRASTAHEIRTGRVIYRGASRFDELGNASEPGLPVCEPGGVVGTGRREEGRAVEQPSRSSAGVRPPGPTNGFWRDADWLACRDGKWRPVEPGTSPLVDGASARVVRLRGYGNAINAEAATQFIHSYIEARGIVF